MSEYTLHHGDCLDVLPTLEPQSIDAVICDPPYGTTACKWDSVIPFDAMWHGIKRVLRPRGACVLFGSQPFTSALVMSNVGWFKEEVIWEKTRATTFTVAKFVHLKAHESMIVFAAGGHTYNPQMNEGEPYSISARAGALIGGNVPDNRKKGRAQVSYINDHGRYPRSVVKVSNPSLDVGQHPTQKPLALLEYLVKTYTNAGDVVLDFTMGSGTTGHACGNLSRRFIGIEQDAGYFAIAQERIATAYAPLRLMQEAV